MGQSTDAIVAYGVDLGDEVPAWLWKFAGVERDEESTDTYALSEALGAKGLTIELHCSDPYPMYVLAVDASVTTAHRGSPQKLPRLDAEKHQAAWEKSGVPCKKKPAWLLFSWWC